MPKLTEEEKELRQELKNKYYNSVLKYGGRVGAFATFTGFRQWAMEHGYQPGCELRRYDSEEDFTPDNCYFRMPPDPRPFYGEEKEDWLRRWNRAVNPLRIRAGLPPFPDPVAGEEHT